MLLGMVSSFKYDQAIILPKSDRDAEALLFLSIILTLCVTFFLSLFIFIFYDFLIIKFEKLSFLLWLMPISTLTIGLLQIFTTYSNRKKIYKEIASIQVANAGNTVGIQAISRYFFQLDGLIIGKLLGDFVALLLYLRIFFQKQTLVLKSLSKRRVRVNAKRYEDFPKYQLPIVFINTLSQNVPLLMFGFLFSSEIAGFYAVTTRILYAPITLVSGSVREVYYQKASDMYANGQNIYTLYVKTTLGLLKLAVIPFFIILFWGEEIFSSLFDAKWVVSGLMAEISIVWFLFSFISPAVVVNYNILGIQRVQFKIQIVLIILRILAIYLGFFIWDSYIASLILYTAVGAVVNIFSIFYIGGKVKCS
jgi:O-antigen/teichoic acid export membrane protein